MTDLPEKSLIEEVEATDAGAQGLAAAKLAGEVNRLLHAALAASNLEQKDLADKIGVTQGRVSQVLNGDGNVRIAALARYLRALGYEAEITLKPVDAGVPEIASSRRPPRARAEEDLAASHPGAVSERLASTSLTQPTVDWSFASGVVGAAGIGAALQSHMQEVRAQINQSWATLHVLFTDCAAAEIVDAARFTHASQGPTGTVDLLDEEYAALCESHD